MNKSELENYTGNLRIAHIDFDGLRQMWEGALDEYDPKKEEPLAKFYIGKIGKYEPCSYVSNKYLKCACISVTFANGYSVMVGVNDVVETADEATWVEFLPQFKQPGEDTRVYKPLTDAQKEFADKMFLQLIVGQHQLHDKDLQVLLDQSINMAQYRSEMYSRNWDDTWLKELNE